MKNKLFFLALLFPLIAATVGRESAKEYRLDIQILDSKTNEPLEFINVIVSDATGKTKGAYTSENGKTHFFLPKGSYKLESRMVGYQILKDSLDLFKDTSLVYKMSEETVSIDEIVVMERVESRADFAPARSMTAPPIKKRKLKESRLVEDEWIDDGEAEAGLSAKVKSGTLTAGEINDFAKWVLWEDLEKKEFEKYKKDWSLSLNKRFSVQVTFANHLPVVDAEVQLVNDKNEIEFKARTDNTGKAELWANLESKANYTVSKRYSAHIIYKEQKHKIEKLKEAPEALNKLTIEIPCQVENEVDIAFVVDATGSMGDEIEYLKEELADVLLRVKGANSGLSLNTASVFYRDHTDDYLVRKSGFSQDMSVTLDFIKRQSAFGGGDFPEAVDAALETAINDLEWNKHARARLMFLLLDAPPHKADSVIIHLQKLIYMASAKGIRIIPVTGSGIDKSVEFLMRSLALATNGTYTFLTDDSGVGGSHIAPSTDSYKVEKLNDLMVRLCNQYLESTGCNYVPKIPSDSSQSSNSADSLQANQKEKLSLNCFPVPSKGLINIEVNKSGGTGFICDINGKYVMRFEVREAKKIQKELGQLASGTYFVRYQYEQEWRSQKIILQH